MERAQVVPLLLGLVGGAFVVAAPLGKYTLDLRSAFDSAQQEVVHLQDEISRLQSANSQLQAQRVELVKPDLPISVSVRNAIFSTGLVVTLKNTSASDLAVTGEIRRPGAPSQTRELVISANGVREIGEREGWAFVVGDSIVLSNPQFRDINQTLVAR
jgi:hypothetical protein